MLNLLAQKQLQLFFEDVENIFGNFTEKTLNGVTFLELKSSHKTAEQFFKRIP